METHRLLIRPAIKKDAEDLYQARISEFVLRYNAIHAISMEAFEKELNQEHVYVLEHKEEKKAIGIIELHEDSLRYQTETKEIAFWLDQKYAKQKYMQEALQALIHDCFIRRHFKGLTARSFKENGACHHLLKNLGFKKEGTLRNAVKDYQHEIHDDCLFYLENKNLHYVYILRCANQSLYTGYTNHLEKRLEKHNSKQGAKYTKAFGPCRLVYYEIYASKQEALQREYAIKQLTKQQKEVLISTKKI